VPSFFGVRGFPALFVLRFFRIICPTLIHFFEEIDEPTPRANSGRTGNFPHDRTARISQKTKTCEEGLAPYPGRHSTVNALATKSEVVRHKPHSPIGLNRVLSRLLGRSEQPIAHQQFAPNGAFERRQVRIKDVKVATFTHPALD